MKTFEHQVLR